MPLRTAFLVATAAAASISHANLRFESPVMIASSDPRVGSGSQHCWFPHNGGVIGNRSARAIVTNVRHRCDGGTGCPPSEPLPHPYETLISWDGSRSYSVAWSEPQRERIGGFAAHSDSHGRLIGSCCVTRAADGRSFVGGSLVEYSVASAGTLLERRTHVGEVSISGFESAVDALGWASKVVEASAGSLVQLRAFSPHTPAGALAPDASLAAFGSSDGGVHWQLLSLVATRNESLRAMGWEGPGENDLLLLRDGSLLAVFRVQSCKPYWSATSKDGGRTWASPVALGFGSVRPKLARLRDGRVLLAGGRPGLFLWLADPQAMAWTPIHLAATHNQLLAGSAHLAEWLYADGFTRAGGECVAWNSTAAEEAFMQGSSAYSSLIDMGGGEYVVQYDRLANGWSPPMWKGRAGVFGSRDYVFAMRFTVPDASDPPTTTPAPLEAAAHTLTFSPPVIYGSAFDCAGFQQIGLPAGYALGTAHFDGVRGYVGTTDGGRSWARIFKEGPPPAGLTAPVLLPDGSLHNMGAVVLTRQQDKDGRYTSFNSSWSTKLSVDTSTGRFTFVNQSRPVTFRGLPQPATCGSHRHAFGCPFRTGGRGYVRLADGTLVMTIVVYWDGKHANPHPQLRIDATSVVAFRSTDDGYTWEYAGTVADAAAFPQSREGPNENDLALLKDATTILCVMRLDAGDGDLAAGATERQYLPYAKATSTDGGRTWQRVAVMQPGVGCARPRLLRLDSGALVLSGGRLSDTNRDVLLWLNAAGDGGSWRAFSLSYRHNLLEPNASLHFTPTLNTSNYRQSMSYTSLVATGPASGFVTYGRRLPNTTDVAFVMRFTVGGAEGAARRGRQDAHAPRIVEAEAAPAVDEHEQTRSSLPCIYPRAANPICATADDHVQITTESSTPAIASTVLEGCVTVAGAGWELPTPTTLRNSRTVRCRAGEYHSHDGVEANVTDIIALHSSSAAESALTWDVRVESSSSFFWTAPVVTTISIPRYDDATSRVWIGGVLNGFKPNATDDPLDAFQLSARCPAAKPCEAPYGGEYARVQRGIPREIWDPALALPAFTVLSHGSALALVQSPQTVAVGASFTAAYHTHRAQLNYTRFYHRLGNGAAPAVFAQRILLHTTDCWRPTVAHMLSAWSEWFRPDPQVQSPPHLPLP